MFSRSLLLLLGCLWTIGLAAQTNPVTGIVTDINGSPLTGATVQWKGGGGTVTDVDGKFVLDRTPATDTLMVSYVGYVTQVFGVAPSLLELVVPLVEGSTLNTVEVTGKQQSNFTSILTGHNIESITSQELRKAPCCSLGESFETNPTVDLNYGDALTGTREIQMLGLRGTYTQLTLEKRPTMTGLATPYALDFYPGTWIQGIQIGKGATSVQSGSSGLAGQINAEIVKPMLDDALFVNLFGSTMGRGEANVHLNQQMSDEWSQGLLLHGSFIDNQHDFDGDRFLDMPNRQTGAGMYRLFRRGPTWEGQFNVLGVRDRRQGGQYEVHDHGQAIMDPYLLEQANERLEVFGKVGYTGFAQPYRSTGFIWSGALHRLNNLYGRRQHSGTQRTAYANWLYATIIGTTDHQLMLGSSYQYDDINEALDDRAFDRTEHTASVYGEYTYFYESLAGDSGTGIKGLTTILALRLDHHNLGGWQAVPRLNVKANLSEDNALRASIGRGWRSPNVLVENLGWLASSRAIVLEGTPQLETAWNMGLNYTQNFRLSGREGSLVLDAYRTDFTNQIVVDMETDIDNLYFYNLDGKSYSNSLLASITYELLPRFTMKLAYKYNDTRTTYRNEVRQVPLVPLHRGLITADYEARRWRLNAHLQIVGEQRLPDQSQIPATVTVYQPQIAPAYGILNAQLTWIGSDRLEVYAGGENLSQVRQRNAIIGAWEPFGDYFDATQVYAPIFGARAHVGLRYRIAQ